MTVQLIHTPGKLQSGTKESSAQTTGDGFALRPVYTSPNRPQRSNRKTPKHDWRDEDTWAVDVGLEEKQHKIDGASPVNAKSGMKMQATGNDETQKLIREELKVTSDPGMAAMIQAEIDNMPRKTRAKAQAIKQNAVDAGLLLPEKKPKVRKPVLVTHIGYSSDEDSDSEPDDVFESERKPMNPWPKISVLESADAWSAWEADQDYHDRLLRSPNYTPGSAKSTSSALMKDLLSTTDPYEANSPTTFEPDIHQWRHFEDLAIHLREHCNGREDGFVKTRVPKEALVPSSGIIYLVDEVPTVNHRLRLDKLHAHPKFKTKGIYRVKLSSNPYQDSTLTWRAVFNDYERECESIRTETRDIGKNRRLDALVQIHYQRQERELAWRQEKEYLARSNAMHVKETRLRRRTRQKETEVARGRQSIKPEYRTISKDQTDLDDASSNSENLTSSSKASTDPKSSSVSDDYTASEAPTKTKPPKSIPPFTEEIMLSLPGRHQSITYSSNNTATPSLRLKLRLPTLTLPSPFFTSSHLHLSGNAGTTLPLSTPLPLGIYSLYYNHRGAPIHLTIIKPRSVRKLEEMVHKAMYTWGAGFGRPRRPPVGGRLGERVGGEKGLGEKRIYVARERLREWGVECKSVRLGIGEGVLLMGGAVVQGFWEECGVLEVLVGRGKEGAM
ncbi:MAG: hypothetical protein Q9204_006549 [Flavoplaca sp. TL-2023a]